MTHQPFQIKFLCLLDIDIFYAQSCFKDSTSPDGFPTPDSAEQKPEGHSGNMELGFWVSPYFHGWKSMEPKIMAESSPSVFLICDGSPDLGQFWHVKGRFVCSIDRPSLSPLHRFYHHFKSSLTLCLTVALLCVRRISTRSNIWNSNGPKRQSVPSCPNRSTLSGC